jgi:hypothetical protein
MDDEIANRIIRDAEDYLRIKDSDLSVHSSEYEPIVIVVPVLEFAEVKIIGESNYTITLDEKCITFNCDKLICEEPDEDTKATKERRVHHFFFHRKQFVSGVDLYWSDTDKKYNLKIKLQGDSSDWVMGCESLSHGKKVAEQIKQWLIS